MALLLTFGVALLVAVLVSERAERTVLSTAVLFLATGLVFGSIAGPPDESVVRTVSELALVTVLLTDASRASVQHLKQVWRLPGRALLLGFPLTMAITAALAVALLGISWTEALLVGAVLAPTDPVFASAIAGTEAIPRPVRDLLSVESGVNDGLALPFVIALLAFATRESFSAPVIAAELLGGLAIGVAVPWIAILLARTSAFGVTGTYEPLGTLAAGIVVYAMSSILHANPFLASFAAGVTIGTASPRAKEAFEPLGENLGEILKLGALLLFGAMLSAGFVAEVGIRGWAFAALALLLARPLALAVALFRSRLGWRDRAIAGWFGPKGFASVVYGLLVAHASLARSDLLIHVIGATVLLSIVAHSSTDVPVTQWLQRPHRGGASSGPPALPRRSVRVPGHRG